MSRKTTNRHETQGSDTVTVTPKTPPSDNHLVVAHLQRMPHIAASGLIYLSVLVLVCGLLYSALAEIDTVVECRALAVAECRKMNVLSDRNGYLIRICVSEGQSVAQGTPLFVIHSKETIRCSARIEELRHAIPLKRQNYENQAAKLREKLHHGQRRSQNAKAVLRLRLDQNRLRLDGTDSELVFQRKEVARVTQELEATRRLLAKGAATATELRHLHSQLERAQAEVKKNQSLRNVTLKEKSILEARLAEESAACENDKALLEREIRSLELDKQVTLGRMESERKAQARMLAVKDPRERTSAAAGTDPNILRAPKAGVVSELCFRNEGQYVKESDVLCTIVPADGPICMEVVIANKDVGFVEEGMAIRYKFDAFPYADYGPLKGTVAAIAPSAVKDGTDRFVYRLRGTVDSAYFTIRGRRYAIKPGMTGRAEIITGSRRVLASLVRKLR